MGYFISSLKQDLDRTKNVIQYTKRNDQTSVKFDSGLLIEFGYAQSTSGKVKINFINTYSKNPSVHVTGDNVLGGDNWQYQFATDITTKSFNANVYYSGQKFSWQAIGYWK